MDILVVMPHEGRVAEECAHIRRRVDASFPLNLLVRSAEKLLQRLEWGDFFLRDIVEKGEILYEGAHVWRI